MQSDRVILDIGSVGDFGYSRFCVPAQGRDFFITRPIVLNVPYGFGKCKYNFAENKKI